MYYVIAIWVTMMADSGLEKKFGYIGQPLPTMEVCEQYRNDFKPVQDTVAKIAMEDGVESVKTKCLTVDEYNVIGKTFFLK